MSPTPVGKDRKDASERTTSRAGSHAGRGFRYQDAAGVWLAVRSWAGEIPFGEIVPEGRDDYDLRGRTKSALAQVKSRRDHLGLFPAGEAAEFIRELWSRSEALSSTADLVLLLERAVSGGPLTDHKLAEHPGLIEALCSDPRWATLAPRTDLWIMPAPFEAAVATISRTASCKPLAAQIYYGELLHQIGTLADANGLVRQGVFNGLAISDVETSVRRLEPALDLANMESALRDGHCEAIDFLTPVDDPAFYQGVDTRPGHLASGLVAERPIARGMVLDALEAAGSALIVGPSGAGKSALMWEAARAARHTIRWFEVRRGDPSDVHLLIRLARELRASATAPVGFIMDDIGRRGLSNLWDALSREAGVGTGLLLLGTIREEDIFLLPSRARAREVRPTVDEAVAERIWRRLKGDDKTSWAGWGEPWARSNGLLLEYAHILTRGDRLESILGEQVDQRLREARDAELAVLRVAALAGAAGAMLETQRLPTVLQITTGDLGRALRRLFDEHLIGEPAAGRVGGLHQLRSMVLSTLCHALPPANLPRTISEAVQSATSASLAPLASHVAVHHPEHTDILVSALAARLEADRDLPAATSALSGLGQAHIEATLRTWILEALSIGLEPTQITSAVMFAVTDTDLSSLPFPERFKSAMRALRTRSKSDPRLCLLSAVSQDAIGTLVVTADLMHLRALLSALVGMDIPNTIQSALGKAKPQLDGADLSSAAELLATMRLIDANTAIAWASGGVSERLLSRVATETPWASNVQIEDAPEGRLLRSSIRHVAAAQENLHEEVVDLCRRVLGLDPTAAVAAVDAIAADDEIAGLPGCPVATKRIPRENLPPSALPEWNQRWIAGAARLVGAESHTEYLQQARNLLENLVPAAERAVDRLLRGKMPPPQVLKALGEVHETSRALTPPRDGPLSGGPPRTSTTQLQNLLFACSADLIRRFNGLPDGYGSFVLWIGDLLKDVEASRAEPWNLLGPPPVDHLKRLEGLLVSLRLLAAESGYRNTKPSQLWLSVTSRADRGKALQRAKVAVNEKLQRLFSSHLQDLKVNLAKNHIEADLFARPNWKDLLPWPNLELLAIVRLDSPEDWAAWVVEQGPLLREIAGEGRQMWVVPTVAGLAVSRLTIGGVSTLLPASYTVDGWLDALRIPRLNDALTRASEPVLSAVTELDGLRRFGFGTEVRPAIERQVRRVNEQRLIDGLSAFEALADGTAVQFFPRQLIQEVEAGKIALAVDVAAMTHGNVAPGMEVLTDLQNALLIQDVEVAQLAGLVSEAPTRSTSA